MRIASRAVACVALLAAACAASVTAARADPPDWLRAAARAPLPAYSSETDAVVLLSEHEVTVSDTGEIRTVFRRAYKILRPGGRDVARVVVYYDSETRLTFFKGWSITAQGREFELKEKDALETMPFSGSLYEDTRAKILPLPGAEPGTVVGYEFEQRHRPHVLQDVWVLQDQYPVRRTRYLLRLPRGWEYKTVWLNRDPAEPAAGANQWSWEVTDLPGFEAEPAMPHWRSLAARLALQFYPPAGSAAGATHRTWEDVGRWYARLAHPRRASSPEMAAKVAELTASAVTPLEKIRALAAFAQRDIRYVAIEIGIGGYQPFPASRVFTNRYGDCKDKVTLLSTMLREIGIESFYVLAHSYRGAIAPEFPSMLNFNHAILAMRLPDEVVTTTLFALEELPGLGRVLYFDPTDSNTPLGYLPGSLQANYGLLVTEDGGRLVTLPLLSPSVNRLLRTGKMTLSSTGSLTGEVQEIRWGAPAVNLRVHLLARSAAERSQYLERFIASFIGGARLTSVHAENLEDFSKSLVLRYRFVAETYARSAGDLLLLSPRALGGKTWTLLERKDRKHPVEYLGTSLESDAFEFVLPEGFVVEELPAAIEAEGPSGAYRSKTEVQGQTLRYSRQYQIRQVRIPVTELGGLRDFYRRVAADERSMAVLRRAAE